MLRRTSTAMILAVSLGLSMPALAVGTSQSVPVNDQDVIENTKQISEYLRQLNQFFGAKDTNALSNSTGLDLSESLSSIKGGGFGQYKTDSLNITLNSDFAGAQIDSQAIRAFYESDKSSLCNQISTQTQLANKAKTAATTAATKAAQAVLGIGNDISLSGISEDSNPTVRMSQACNSARNMIAMTLYDIQKAIVVLEKRNTALQSYLKEKYSDSGQLQKRQYQIGVMQALIQNDMARLQAALAAYQTKIAYYKQIQAEALNDIQYGTRQTKNMTDTGSGNPIGNTLGQMGSSTVSTMAGIGVGIATAEALDSGNSSIIDGVLEVVSSVYDTFKKALGIDS